MDRVAGDDKKVEVRSACAERARELTRRQLEAMTPLERIALALRLGRRDAEIRRRYAAAASYGL